MSFTAQAAISSQRAAESVNIFASSMRVWGATLPLNKSEATLVDIESSLRMAIVISFKNSADVSLGELSPNFGDGVKDQAAAWA